MVECFVFLRPLGLRLTTSFTIDKYKFYLPAGKPIELAIEAFDIVGDFSKERAKYVIENTSRIVAMSFCEPRSW